MTLILSLKCPTKSIMDWTLLTFWFCLQFLFPSLILLQPHWLPCYSLKHNKHILDPELPLHLLIPIARVPFLTSKWFASSCFSRLCPNVTLWVRFSLTIQRATLLSPTSTTNCWFSLVPFIIFLYSSFHFLIYSATYLFCLSLVSP